MHVSLTYDEAATGRQWIQDRQNAGSCRLSRVERRPEKNQKLYYQSRVLLSVSEALITVIRIRVNRRKELAGLIYWDRCTPAPSCGHSLQRSPRRPRLGVQGQPVASPDYACPGVFAFEPGQCSLMSAGCCCYLDEKQALVLLGSRSQPLPLAGGAGPAVSESRRTKNLESDNSPWFACAGFATQASLL